MSIEKRTTGGSSPPPAYAWVDVEMTFLLDGGTPAQLLSILQSAFPHTEAVVLQLQFLSGGGTLQQLESYFAIVKRVWTNVKGTPNPAYGWVDAGMTFLINGGTEAQYSEAVRAVVF